MKELVKKIQNNNLKKSKDWVSDGKVTEANYLERHQLELNKGILQQRGVRTVTNKYRSHMKESLTQESRQDLSKLWTLVTHKMTLEEVYLNYMLIVDYVLREYISYTKKFSLGDNLWEAKLADKYSD